MRRSSNCQAVQIEEGEKEAVGWTVLSGVRRVRPDGRVFQTNDERRTEARDNRRLGQ